jgi:hypothetical protein
MSVSSSFEENYDTILPVTKRDETDLRQVLYQEQNLKIFLI